MGGSQAEKGLRFRALHEAPGCFVIPNPWDAGSARILASLGFEALATTSAGCAFSLGQADGCGAITPEQTLANAAQIVAATDLPVSSDLEDGWSERPDAMAEAIGRAAAVGAVGASIEDSSGDPGCPIYEFELAVDRIRAAAEAAHGLNFPFTLTARAENHLHGRNDLADTVRRLQAFQEAGADVLYAPGLATADAIRSVVTSVDRPVNVLMGLAGVSLRLSDVAELGVSRVSLGSSLVRSALGQFVRAAREVREHGTFTFAQTSMPYAELNALFGRGAGES